MTTTYDTLAQHLNSPSFPDDLPAAEAQSAAATHLGFYWYWVASQNLVSAEFAKSAATEALSATRDASPSAIAAAIHNKLDDTMLSEQGNAFTAAYYDQFLDDLDTLAMDAFQDDDVTLYDLPDDWQVYDAVEMILTARFEDWQDAPDEEFPPLDLSDEESEEEEIES